MVIVTNNMQKETRDTMPDIASGVSLTLGASGKPMDKIGSVMNPLGHDLGRYQLGMTPAEQHEALQHGSSSSASSVLSSSPTTSPASSSGCPSSTFFDGLVLDKLAAPAQMVEDQCDSILSSAAVDTFFSSSSDSTPLFGLESFSQSNDPSTWTSLFDDDIPVSLDDALECVPSFSAETAVLPTPVLDDLNVEGSIVKKGVLSEGLRTIAEDTTKTHKETEAQSGKSQTPHTSSFSSATPESLTSILTPTSSPKAYTTTKATGGRKTGSIIKTERYDRLGVITYNKKQRSAPLSPVIPESDDPAAVKRARNTEAARRSRARKLERMNQLEVRVEELLQKNSQLEDEVTRLRALLSKQA